jgi:hypothetical protein
MAPLERSPAAAGSGATAIEVDPGDPPWDDFVAERPGGRVYHLSAWGRILGGAYGYRPRYMALEDGGGGLRAVLPLMETRGLVTGRRLRSLPVVPPAGPLARSEDDMRAILEAGCALAEERDARVWTIHARDEGLELIDPRLRPVPKAPTWILRLPSDPDELRAAWRKGSKNLHRNVGKAEKADLVAREAHDERDLRAFFRLYLATMRKHRVLPRSYRQLSLARDLLPEGVFRLFVVEHAGHQVAGGVFHAYRGTVDLLYNASDERHLDLRPNHALYWHVIRWAIERGHGELDFGHAWPGSPLARFKEQWGSEPVAEHRYDVGGGEGGEGDRASRLRYATERLEVEQRERLVARAWSRAPLALTRLAAAVAYRWV